MLFSSKFRSALAIAVLTGGSLQAGQVSPVQSTARPLGWSVAAPVQKSGSDARAAAFNQNELPVFRQLINQTLAESANFVGRDGFRLDASKLFLRTASDQTIRIYFVHEGAGYQNSLALARTPAGSPQMGEPLLIFPNASFAGPNSTTRKQATPLIVGDFVELDRGAPGIQLDFILAADGAARPSNPIGPWYNDKSRNVDGKQHVVAFLLPGSRFVLIGFEDLHGGGDLDYNDCLFAIDIGQENAANLFDIEATLPE